MTILRLEKIVKSFPILRGALRERSGVVKAVDNVTLEIGRGETFGLVGESGCGKTTLGRIALGILRQDSGSVDRATDKIQAIFQDPYTSLDPKMRLERILAEGLILQGERAGIRQRIEGALDMVHLPKSALARYPHEFSGGERQRIAIARAILTGPELIVCDEPVSSLDVTIQIEILRLLKDVQKKLGAAYLFISHDLRVVRFMADRIAVMRQGRIAEEGVTAEIYSHPRHPYTQELLSSIPSLS